MAESQVVHEAEINGQAAKPLVKDPH